MTKFAKIIITIIVLIIVGVGAFLYATRPVVAPSVDVTEQTATSTATSTDTTNTTGATSTNNSIQSYRLSSSTAQFEIDEVLNGKPKHVIGNTNQVSGTVSVNSANPEASVVSTIKINARTFKTDSDRRDASIGRFILKSESAANEFIEFKPKTVDQLKVRTTQPADPNSFAGAITGDLTIAGVTKTGTFNVVATIQKDGSIVIDAFANVKYKDFGITIPEVPFVANVSDEVVLKLHTTLVK